MHKVVVERPRGGQAWARQFPRPRRNFDDLPAHEGIRRPHVHRKWLTDLLGPLRRWLHSQVGRPWNDVYSEACAVIKPDSIIRAHIKTHLLEFVERHTFVHGGKVCVLDTGYRGRGIVPVMETCQRRVSFFVHPETGLLCELRPPSRQELRAARREQRKEGLRWLDGRVALKQIKGCWFACQYRVISSDGPFKAYDHALESVVGRGGLLRHDGDWMHCIDKRQLSRRELRRFGLRNSLGKGFDGAQASRRHDDALKPALP